MAIDMVAEILERERSTEGNKRSINSFISREQILRVVTQIFAHLDTKPNSRHETSSLWGER